MVIVGRIALPLGRGRNAGDGQFLWPRRAPIIGHYRTLHTMVIFGRIALPLWAWTKAVGAGGTIGTDRAMHHDLVASGFRDFQSARERLASLCSGSEIRQIDADFLGAVQRWAQGIARRPIR